MDDWVGERLKQEEPVRIVPNYRFYSKDKRCHR